MLSSGILPTYHGSHRYRKSFWKLPGDDFGFVFVLGFGFWSWLVRSYSLRGWLGLRIFVGGLLCSCAPDSGKPAVAIYRFGFGDRYTDGWGNPSTPHLDNPLTPYSTFAHHIFNPTLHTDLTCTFLVWALSGNPPL